MTKEDIWDDIIAPFGLGFMLILAVSIVVLALVCAFNAVFGRTPEQEAELNKPRIVSKFEDCEIWIFENTHYVTRCGNHTVTERHYSESCGKACTKQKVERIEND